VWVEKIFWQDPYLTELTAQVTGVVGQEITVDRTIAYAFSGGQESDHGTINGHEIIRAEKQNKEIIYVLEPSHKLQVGDIVLMKIDWERRYKLMQLHFTAEVILELCNQYFSSPPKIGAHIAADKARLDFVWTGNISETFEFLTAQFNLLRAKQLPITSNFSDQENEIRYWEVEGFARVLCGGTHIRNTGELAEVVLKRNNIGKSKERIELTFR
jgi:Ser-tRNA(Ala) deacylase AlaX